MRSINIEQNKTTKILYWPFLIIFFLLPVTLFPFENLPEKYTVSLGNPQSKTHIVEYFSLSCPLCLKLLKADFPTIYKEHISNETTYWTFHPDPQDITTLQLMICLDLLPQEKKWKFFWEVINVVNPQSSGKNTFLIQELVKRFDQEMPLLYDIKWLEQTDAYQEAFKYLKQKDIPEDLPSITNNGVFMKGIPTKTFIRKVLQCN